jgi:glycosyltransferase involved in cell wall biosynthesis
MKRKSVLFPFTGVLVGGAVVSGSLIAKSLAAKTDWHVMVALPNPGPNTTLFEKAGLMIDYYNLTPEVMHRLRKSSGYKGKIKAIFAYHTAYKRAAEYLNRNKPDIVHINDDRSIMTWGLAAKLRGIPVIWHIRQERGNHLLDQWRLSLARSLIFVAEANRVRFKHLRRLPPNETIHNGVELNRFYPGDKRQSKQRLGLPEERTVVGFIGNLTPRKRPEWFVEAGIDCLVKGADAHFVLIGEDLSGGPYLNRLQERVREAGVQDRFAFLGYRDDIPEILRAFDILALTSEPHGEAFPRAIIEAMASGVPVVATNVAGVPEAVVSGKTGWLADPENPNDLKQKLYTLIMDKDMQEEMAFHAKEAANLRFSSDEVARRVQLIYEQHHNTVPESQFI